MSLKELVIFKNHCAEGIQLNSKKESQNSDILKISDWLKYDLVLEKRMNLKEEVYRVVLFVELNIHSREEFQVFASCMKATLIDAIIMI